VKQVLGSNKLEDGVAQVLQPLVVSLATFGMLVVIGAVGQCLPKEGNIVKPNTQRTL